MRGEGVAFFSFFFFSSVFTLIFFIVEKLERVNYKSIENTQGSANRVKATVKGSTLPFEKIRELLNHITHRIKIMIESIVIVYPRRLC